MHKGSFNWYLENSGDFVTAMALAIQRADDENLARLSLAFPQMVEAYKCNSWDNIPVGFDPVYNARASGCDLCKEILIFPAKTEDMHFCMKCGREKHNTKESL